MVLISNSFSIHSFIRLFFSWRVLYKNISFCFEYLDVVAFYVFYYEFVLYWFGLLMYCFISTLSPYFSSVWFDPRYLDLVFDFGIWDSVLDEQMVKTSLKRVFDFNSSVVLLRIAIFSLVFCFNCYGENWVCEFKYFIDCWRAVYELWGVSTPTKEWIPMQRWVQTVAVPNCLWKFAKFHLIGMEWKEVNNLWKYVYLNTPLRTTESTTRMYRTMNRTTKNIANVTMVGVEHWH